MSQALCFNDVTLIPVNHQNQIWIKASELSRALGYSSEEKVSRLYRRNEDEFTPDMTQVIEICTEAHFGGGRMRIFSLRGCHLIAMFARTSVAKSFRKWVLDVLDKLNEQQPTSHRGRKPRQKALPEVLDLKKENARLQARLAEWEACATGLKKWHQDDLGRVVAWVEVLLTMTKARQEAVV